jgi:hypothetical protein
MLLLPLAGNPSVDKSGTISLIQIKLRENRLLYKTKCKVPETTANTKANAASAAMKQIKEDFASDDEVESTADKSPVEAKCSPVTSNNHTAVLVQATALPLDMDAINAVTSNGQLAEAHLTTYTPMYMQQNVSCV